MAVPASLKRKPDAKVAPGRTLQARRILLKGGGRAGELSIGLRSMSGPSSWTQPFLNPSVQPKLEVGAVNDRFEREADELAERVMRTPDSPTACQDSMDDRPSLPSAQRLIGSNSFSRRDIQRKCESCEDETDPTGDVPVVRMKSDAKAEGLVGGAATRQFEHNLLVERARGGLPLTDSVRRFVEPRFHTSFDDVRVHRGKGASELATAIGARAFTVGREIFFKNGAYRPDTHVERKLLVHELTHVLQQRNPSGHRADGAQVRRSPDSENVKLAGPCADVPWPEVTLRSGSVNPAVRAAQRQLNLFHRRDVQNGGPGLPHGLLVEDCIYGPLTASAVVAVQARGFPGDPLEWDGIVGPKTWELLDNVEKLVAKQEPPPAELFDEDPLATQFSFVGFPVLGNQNAGQPSAQAPEGFCEPLNPVAAELLRRTMLSTFIPAEAAVYGLEVAELWRRYLTREKGDSLVPRIFSGSSTIAEGFRDSETIVEHEDNLLFPAIVDALVQRCSRLPANRPVDLPLGLLLSTDVINFPINFNRILEIPGNIAGGVGGSDAGMDRRQVSGSVRVTRTVDSAGKTAALEIETGLRYFVKDTIDFCPGDPGAKKEQRLTVPLSRLEASNFAYDVPFLVFFPGKPKTLVVSSTELDACDPKTA